MQQGGDRVGISDGTWGEHGACWFDGDGAVRGDGMRGVRVGVGDIGAMPCGARGSGDASCGDDGRGEGRECDRGMVGGLGRGENCTKAESGGDRVSVSDGTWGEHGACRFDGDGAVRGDGMRGDRVGVGDIGAMPFGARGSGDASCGDDGRGEERELVAGMVGGLGRGQHGAQEEPGGDRVSVSDGTRGEDGACWFDGDVSVRGDGMRGDRVGVGDISAMPCGARGSGDASCGDDGRGAIRQL
jgi:hypothetical protein